MPVKHSQGIHVNKNTITANALQDLLHFSWQKAIKYRFDPVLSQTHEEYLQLIKAIINELNTRTHTTEVDEELG